MRAGAGNFHKQHDAMYWIEVFGDPDLGAAAEREARRMYEDKSDAWRAARNVEKAAPAAQVFVTEGEVSREAAMSVPVLEEKQTA